MIRRAAADCLRTTIVSTLGASIEFVCVTVTLSKVSVPTVELTWLVTASPAYTVEPIGMVACAYCVHVEPFAERYAVNVQPARTSLTHTGAEPAPPEVELLAPPAAPRHVNDSPWPGVSAPIACREPALRSSRIITPASAHGSVASWLATRATMLPSPVVGRYAYRNESAASQMSTPLPCSVKTPEASAADPATPTEVTP